MPNAASVKEAIDKLFAQIAIPESDVIDWVGKAIDCEYWRKLCPGMGVCEQQERGSFESKDISPKEIIEASTLLQRRGYFQLPALTSPNIADRMYHSVETVRSAGWPAVFSFVYDDFWEILRTPTMVQFLGQNLGGGYLQTADIWTHRVDPRNNASGFRPHHDSRGDTERLTVWIPLNDATVDNSCMYVIPRDKIPKSLDGTFSNWTSISKSELKEILHNVTPLPAPPGAVLGWSHRLIHWGGRAMKSDSQPRISISVGFLQEGEAPRTFELPLFGSELPNLQSRLRVIGQAILGYSEREPLMRRYEHLAEKLIAWKGIGSEI